MMTCLYTKIILTIIALSLSVIAMRNMGLIVIKEADANIMPDSYVEVVNAPLSVWSTVPLNVRVVNFSEFAKLIDVD